MLKQHLLAGRSENRSVIDTIQVKRTTNRIAFWATAGAVIIVQILVWFLFYPLAGYNDTTVTIATGTFLFLGLAFVALFNLGWRRIGLGPERLWEALPVLGGAHFIILLLLLGLRFAGIDLPVLRNQYSLYSLASNWILSGLGEELLFAGVLFNVVPLSKVGRNRWLAVGAVAVIFALWHLPGYVAVGLRTGTVGVGLAWDLLLRMISWWFFGAIYALSGNLWITAMAHASTDYALLPAIIRTPIVGLLFMILLITGAWWIGRGKATLGKDPLVATQ